MKAYLDAGHGGADSGAVGVSGRYEKDDNLKLALALKKELEARGHQAALSRDSDAYPTLKRRAESANASGAQVFLSLHRNSASPSANGVEVLYCPGASRRSQDLAREISAAVAGAAGFKNRGAKCQRAYVLEKTSMPAVTVESGFVTHAGDNKKFDGNTGAIAAAIAAALEREFGAGAADALAYRARAGAKLWADAGASEPGRAFELESYWGGDKYAQVSANGKLYLIEWADLEKA